MPSNFGESGAPAIDLKKGGVVAIKYGGRDPAKVQDVNYLIPLNLAKGMLDEYCNVQIPNTVVDDPLLQSVRVSFILPPGDNRDVDTGVAVSIAKGSLVLAGEDNLAPGVAFADPGNYGPFNLIVRQGITKSTYKDSTVTLTISPNGNDKWVTGLVIEATFSDNQVVKSQFVPTTVDQNNRTVSFQNP
jgi:hypothetical protein